eukprot:8982767-Lingulodinium_polyedra.AAC.1
MGEGDFCEFEVGAAAIEEFASFVPAAAVAEVWPEAWGASGAAADAEAFEPWGARWMSLGADGCVAGWPRAPGVRCPASADGAWLVGSAEGECVHAGLPPPLNDAQCLGARRACPSAA